MPDIQQPQPLGFGQSSLAAPPAPIPEYDAKLELENRRAASSTWDTVKSIVRQDSVVPGLLAEMAGDNTLAPDPKYNPFEDPSLKEVSKGIPEEYMPYLWKAHSAAHARYTADRIREKMADQQRLDDLGTTGNVGRFALGLLMPENLLLDVVGVGLVSGAVQAARVARAARGATSTVGRAAAVAEDAAAQVAAKGSGKAVASGVGFGVAENAAIEKLRQQYNFEDSDEAVLAAGLIGGAFTLPFSAYGARTARRVAGAADREANALRALADAHEGRQLTPEQMQTINQVHTHAKAVEDLEAGRISEDKYVETLLKASREPVHQRVLDDDLMGPHESDANFLDRLQERTRAQADEVIQKYHADAAENSRLIQHQARQFVADSVARRKADAQKLREAAAAHESTGTTLADLQTAPPETPPSAMAQALRKAFGTDPVQATKLKAETAARDAAQAADDAASRAAEAKKAKEDAWAAADAAEARQRKLQEEHAYTQREVLAAELEDPHGAHQAPVEEPTPSEPAAPTRPTDRDLAEAMVGQEVSWLTPDGVVVGTLSHIRDYEGTLRAVIRDEDGKMRSVDPKTLDQWPHTDAPSGFLHGSIGAAQVLPVRAMRDMDRYSSNFTGYSTVPGTNGKVKVPLRFDLYAFMNESQNSVIRRVANALLKDPVGDKDRSRSQDHTAGEWRDQLRRTIAGEFHLTAREALQEARKAAKVPFWDQVGFNARFYEAVSMVTRGDNAALAAWPAASHGAIQKAASAQRKAYAEMLTKMKEAGVEGADQINPNAAYVNRVWRHDKIRQAIATHGEDAVHNLLASSFFGMTHTGPLTGNIQKAKSFLSAIRKLEFGTELQDIHLAARDMHTLREELKTAGLTSKEIDDIVDVMFEKGQPDEQAGKPGNLQPRMSIDETAAVNTHAGTLRIHDLVENDSRVLVDRYVSTMGGHYGLARVGITSNAKFRELVREAEAEHMAMNNGDRFTQELQWLKDAHAHTIGKPMSMADYSGTARFASAARAYTRSITLGQLGLTAAFEMKQAIGVMGMRAFITQLPTFRGFLTGLRQGFVPDPGLARQVLQISGHGSEMAMAYARSREISEDLPAHILGGAEHMGNRLSHMTDVVSGNASMTAMTRQMSAKMSIQYLHDLGETAARMTDKVRNRLAGHGLEGQWADDVVRDLRTFANTTDGVVKDIRLDDWLKHDPETYEAFQVFVGRQVRDVIQDHDLGETMPFMHSTLGKLFAELKTFFFVAHAKNLLKNLNYMDGTTMAVMLYGMVGEAMSYAMQQAINNPGQLDKRLDPEVMGPAVMMRMSNLGFAPMIAETGYQMATGKSLMASGSTSSGTNNRNLFLTPTMQTGQALWNIPGHGLQALFGTNAYTGTDLKSDVRALPLGNTYGMRALANYFAETLPTSNAE